MKNQMAYKLSVSITRQGKRFVAYAPALDLSTSGKSEKEAKIRFTEAATTFFEELTENGNMGEVLTELGWRKQQKIWNPPETISTISIGIRIPSFA